MKIKIWFMLLLLFLLGCSQSVGDETPGTQPNDLAALTQSAAEATAVLPTNTPFVTPSPTADIPKGTVTIWHSWNDQQTVVLDRILEEFSARYPEVLFDVLYVPQENLLTRYETALQEQGGPDLLLGPAEWGPDLYSAGMIADLSNLAAASLLDSINPAALQAVQYQDALIGLPFAQQGVVLYRNKALIDQPPARFDDLVSLAKSATQGEIIGAFLEQSLFFSGAHLIGQGGKLINPDGTPAFNDVNGLIWLELLKAFELAGPTDYLTDQDLKLFKEGRVGWIIDGTWSLDDLIAALGAENLAVDPWPTFKGKSLSGFIQPANIYLSALSQDEDYQAAWKFMEYFLSAENQTSLFEAGLIPVVKGVQASDPRQQSIMRQVLAALAGGTPYPVQPEMQLYLAPLDTALQAALQGNIPAAEALSAAETTILAALAQLRATATPSP